MNDASIELHAVTKSFGRTRAVQGLDLSVPRGSLCGFLGPNGAGKTTTIRMIMSIIYPDAGSVRVLGGSALQSKDRIGYLPEERGLYRKMRVGEFLEYIARLKGVRRHDLPAYVRKWLDRVELGEVYRRKCEELSKGMQQKVQFLCAVLHDPELLILDEPFSGLDPVNTEMLNGLINELHEQGKTIIFSTHILHQAEQICDRILLINKGCKLLDATLEEIRRQFDPRTIVAQPLDGDPGLERVDGVAAARRMPHDGGIELELDDGIEPQEVLRRVLEAAPMRAIELRRLSLNEVFVQLVRRDEGDAAAHQVRQELTHA
jgi:ABC-2 type transport system ATP-binding protein